MAQQKQHPVAVVCTSGSALLNYYPAIAEAFYSNVPLIVISADRPKHLIDIGDGQTIRQENVFKNHSLFNANLVESDGSEAVNSSLINKALQESIVRNGPVHLNVPFDEPLYETVATKSIDAITVEDHIDDEKLLNVHELDRFAKLWNQASKKMILVGACFPDKDVQKQLEQLATDPSVLVLTETTSNLQNDFFINNIDKLIFPLDNDELQELQPEILLTFGGMIVSKKIKQFLRKHQPKEHWHIDVKNAPNTYHCLSHHFEVTPPLFFHELSILAKDKKSNYQMKWLNAKKQRNEKHDLYVSKIDFSDLKVFDMVLHSLPQKSMLQLANSAIIRYVQLFDIKYIPPTFCNRGTSGIDGSTSTAIGASLKTNDRTVFITGDISFFYDSNALWNNYIKNDFRIIIINNAGGGIFRFIPGPMESNAADYFETTHHLNAEHLCAMFGFDYVSAKNENELNQQLEAFYKIDTKPKLLEIFTPKNKNDGILKNYFNSLR